MAKKQTLTPKQEDAIIAKLMKPAISTKTMHKLEQSADAPERRQQRRACLAALTRGLATWEKFQKEEPEAFAEVLKVCEVFAQHAKAVAEMAEAAVFRLRMAVGVIAKSERTLADKIV
jgi:hypothetical protein